jgi:hypothetical protein
MITIANGAQQLLMMIVSKNVGIESFGVFS